MGLPASQPVHARDRHGPGRAADRGKAPPRLCRSACRRGVEYLYGLIAALILCATALAADPALRIATFNTGLSRDGPGLLLRDILRGDPQAEAVAAIIARARADVIVLQGVDYDHDGATLGALAGRIAAAGLSYPHRFALRPNSGMATGLDMDGDGRRGSHADAQGFGRFAGADGMAILSRLPLAVDEVRDFSALLWRDLPGARLPVMDGQPFPSAEVQAVQRLSYVGHWAVPVLLPGGGRFHLLAFHATPPVFDGPEDRNGLRNADELRLWARYLDGALGPPPPGPFVIAGDANLDPFDGDGDSSVMRQFLARPDIKDPAPQSAGAPRAATPGDRGPPAQDTVDWRDVGVGAKRVDYVLPSFHWRILGSGVVWPDPDAAETAERAAQVRLASRHRLVWVDLKMGGGGG